MLVTIWMTYIIEMVMLSMFGILLVHAALEDHKYKRVRRYIWYISGMIGGVLYSMNAFTACGQMGIIIHRQYKREWELLAELICFGLLQLRLFSKMYGRADSYAFICCSMVLSAFGDGMLVYLVHMLVAVVLLGAMQLAYGNVGKDGNLKIPVAFVPYIVVSFFICIFARNVLVA